jgi:(2Fe-2S) ferredoxin
MTQPLPRCSDAARSRGDDPAGTAAPAHRWLLIEHAGPWQREALAASGIAPHVVEALTAAATAGRGRILLIRRPGRALPGGLRSWAVADSAAPGTSPVWGVWEHDRDLLDAVPFLRSGLPTDAGDASPDPVLLVCAHGRHDVCCAVRGRPVAAALQERWPGQTWECSHVGGDRFAANLVVLPDGVFYGNLDAASAVGVVDAHRRGATDVEHLRGLSTEAPLGQVAVAAALARYAPAPARAFSTTSVKALAPHRWRVHLTGTGHLPDLDVVVVTSARPPARLTCAALRDTAAMAYEVESIDPSTG